MPSKKSKPSPKRAFRSNAAPDCSESRLTDLAKTLAVDLKAGERVLLEGPLGVGKTTFARALLAALEVRQPPEGSPTFAIAHEYDSPRGGVVHVDLYRLRSEAEIEEAGIPAYFWEREALVIVEWLSLWPAFAKTVERAARGWRVEIAFASSGDLGRRDVTMTRLSLT